jgi:catechol 2,3-dioxygenase-like lactoylglutathione lyase family enzyme
MDIKFQSSVIFVQDIEASRRFYRDLLGQEVAMDHGPNVGFVGGFAIWQVEHACEVMFDRPPHRPNVPMGSQAGQLGRENLELYFESADLDAVWARLSEAKVSLAHPLREQPWGQRVFRIYDPDGHIVEVGEPMPVVILRFLGQGMSLNEVAGRTSMPLEIVRQIAQGA